LKFKIIFFLFIYLLYVQRCFLISLAVFMGI